MHQLIDTDAPGLRIIEACCAQAFVPGVGRGRDEITT